MASDWGLTARETYGGPGKPGLASLIRHIPVDERYRLRSLIPSIPADQRYRRSGVESKKKLPPQAELPKAKASNVTLSGDRLGTANSRPWTPAPPSPSALHAPRQGTLEGSLLHPTLFDFAEDPTQSAFGSKLVRASSSSSLQHFLPADLNGGSSEMMRSVTNMPLPRTLPDKLDWAHEAYKRQWSAPAPFPYGGLQSKQLQSVGDLGAAGGRALKLDQMHASASVPALAAAKAAHYEPSMDFPSRSLRDYHGNTIASKSIIHRSDWHASNSPLGQVRPTLWEPAAPSSIACSKLPVERRAKMQDRHPFMGQKNM